MVFKKILLLTFLLLVSCTDIKSSRYQDTTHLELPPKMKIVKQPKIQVNKSEESTDAGLGDKVSLAGSTEQPVMKIKKLFDRSWVLVEQALNLIEVEISDKNREKGVFYVTYDPDQQKSSDTNIVDTMTFFLFKDDFAEATYKISVAWQETDTVVSVDLADRSRPSDLLEDQEDIEELDGSVDSGKKLLLNLYSTIRDDLPVN